MKLKRLALETWRGVPSREIEFGDGVTLIEGPNEIGKSTIVEAILTLFEERDSSNKKGVKAVQPIGQDVGSRVEAEIITGDYHFIYSKTYNKDKQTELKILAPKPEQLTGREAHERAEQILDATLDRALWNALLVEQGKEIAGAYLADSVGLARALDEAAGTSTDGQEDSALFTAVQAEYEQYFTLKSGKPRYEVLESQCHSKKIEVNELKITLSEVEADTQSHERACAEIIRLENLLPQMQESAVQHEKNWQEIVALKEKLESKESELEAARQLLNSAVENQSRRQALLTSIHDKAIQLQHAQDQLKPQEGRVVELKKEADDATGVLQASKQLANDAHATEDLARKDQQHLLNAQELKTVQKKIERLNAHNESLEQDRKILSSIRIDQDGLDELREGERNLQIAIGKRDSVTSSIEIKAEKKLQISLNDENLEIAEGNIETRSIVEELRVILPGAASIRVVPSQSANELEAEVEGHKAHLDRLLSEYGVKNLANGVVVEAQRADAERNVSSWNEKIGELLDGQSESDLRGHAGDVQTQCTNYLTDRPAEPAIPTDLNQSTSATESAERTLVECRKTIEELEESRDRLNSDFNEANASYLIAQQEASGVEGVLSDQQRSLVDAQVQTADEVLDQIVEEKSRRLSELSIDYETQNEQLTSVSPDAAQTLLSNSRAASDRVHRDLQDENTRLAVVEDRLEKARANGRFEALEEAEHELDALETRYTLTSERVEAAKLLWKTLNMFRDSARQAYVQPLRDGIEKLGKIVFGTDFSIALGDDWELLSRTQAGKTIPFDDLSVGAKEQMGIITRLAAARIVSNQGGVPIIIDDALGFSDPSRLETMGAAISSAGQDCQVILLTCTPGRFSHVGSADVVKF